MLGSIPKLFYELYINLQNFQAQNKNTISPKPKISRDLRAAKTSSRQSAVKIAASRN